MNNDGVDLRIGMYDNSSDDVDYDKNAINVKKSELVAINDPGCQHLNVELDPTEELGKAYMCKDCHLGWIEQVDSPS